MAHFPRVTGYTIGVQLTKFGRVFCSDIVGSLSRTLHMVNLFCKSFRVPRVALSPRPCRPQHTVRDAPSGESSECETGDARTVRYIFYYYCDHTTQHTLKLKETLRSPHTANAHLQQKRHGPSLIGTTLITEPCASSRSCGSEPVRRELE